MKKYFKLESGSELKLEVKYHKGGYNYFNGENERRGFYLYGTVVQRDRYTESSGIFHTIDGSEIKQGKILIKEVKRFSKKMLEKIEKTINLNTVAEKWKKDINTVFDYVRQLEC